MAMALVVAQVQACAGGQEAAAAQAQEVTQAAAQEAKVAQVVVTQVV